MHSKGADASQKAGGTWARGAGRCVKSVLKKCGGEVGDREQGEGLGAVGRRPGARGKGQEQEAEAGGEGGNRQREGVRRWKTFSLSVVKEAKSSGRP